MPQEKFAQVLPNDWDGTFKFTNDSDEDFVFTWAKKAYLFPARRTVDMMKMNFNATPLEVQQIRKFAAKRWAEREFFKSPRYTAMRAMEGPKDDYGIVTPRLQSFQSAGSYTETDLKDSIQRCLTPLPEGTPLVAPAEMRDITKELHTKDDGTLVSEPIKDQAKSVDPGGILVN